VNLLFRDRQGNSSGIKKADYWQPLKLKFCVTVVAGARISWVVASKETGRLDGLKSKNQFLFTLKESSIQADRIEKPSYGFEDSSFDAIVSS